MYDFQYHEVLGSRDQTEGKGGMHVVRAYLREDDAVEWAQSTEATHECGVMGYGQGEVILVGIRVDGGRVYVERTKIWGYRRNWKGVWDYGWVDNRDAPTNDPDYHEYLRLKVKFEGN